MADVGMAHAGPETLLRGQLLPARRSLRHAGIQNRAHLHCAVVENRSRTHNGSFTHLFRAASVLLPNGKKRAPGKGRGAGGLFPVACIRIRSPPGRVRRRAEISKAGSAHLSLQPRLSYGEPGTRVNGPAHAEKMAEGGIHDHVHSMGKGGGGFARYSTDERWHLPHFEKLLYDNAQLAASYLEAFQISGETLFARIAEDIFNYIMHDMQSPEGGFYSAEDADSFPDGETQEKREGAFYVWSWKEVMSLPAESDKLELFARTYGMKPEGNVSEDPHGEFGGKNVLMEQSAPEKHEKDTVAALDEVRQLLYEKRLQRSRPLLDDKIITSWNGLMISALAKGYRVLGHEEYLRAARNAADFILVHLYEENEGRLLRRYRDGDAAIAGKAEDYAFFVRGLIDLYQACFDNRYLDAADRLCQEFNALFYDHAGGGYFSTATDDDTVPVRLKEEYDGAEPAASSVGILNLLDLAVMTGNEAYEGMAEACFRGFGTMLSHNSHALPLMLAALNNARKGGILAVLAGNTQSPRMQKLLKTLNSRYLPGLTVMHASTNSLMGTEIPAGIDPESAIPAVYLCIGHACRLPANTPEALDELLNETIR